MTASNTECDGCGHAANAVIPAERWRLCDNCRKHIARFVLEGKTPLDDGARNLLRMVTEPSRGPTHLDLARAFEEVGLHEDALVHAAAAVLSEGVDMKTLTTSVSILQSDSEIVAQLRSERSRD